MLKDEYETDEMPEPFVTSPDLEIYFEDTDVCFSFFKYLKRIGAGEIYTQVDGEKDRVYSKGVRFVNRTGVYAFVFYEAVRDMNVDIKLLKKQKHALIKSDVPEKEKDGLLNLLDHIHDTVDPPNTGC